MCVLLSVEYLPPKIGQSSRKITVVSRKKGLWVVLLALGSNWEVGRHSNYQYCVL